MTRKLLECVNRDIKHIDHLLDEFEQRGDRFPLTHTQQWMLWIVRTAFMQQKMMYDINVHSCPDRNVSIFFVMNLVHYQTNYFFDSFFRWINCEPQRILVRNANVMPILESKLTTRNGIWEIGYW